MMTWRSRVAALLAMMTSVPALVLGSTISGSLRDGNLDLITETMAVSIAHYQGDDWTTVIVEDGFYTFEDVAPGEYWLFAESQEEDSWLIPVYYPGIWMEFAVPPFEVEEDMNYAGTDFIIEIGGRVSGSILPAEGGSFPPNGIALGVADDFFSVEGVPLENPSSFLSHPIPSGCMVLVFSATGEEDYHVSTYSGNTWNLWESEEVVIASGQVNNIGTITMAPGGAISGTITGEGEPFEGCFVSVWVFNTPFEPVGYLPGTVSRSDGGYTLRGLPADINLRLFFSPQPESPFHSEWYDNSSTILGATILTVETGELLEGINANLEQGATFHGTLRNPGGALPTEWDWYSFVFYNESGEEFLVDADVETDGTWVTNGALAAGTYTLQVTNFSNPLSLSQFVGNVALPWEADWIEVGSGEVVGPIDFELGHAGAIGGYVLDINGNPMAYTDVFLIRDGNRIGDSSTDSEGSFFFTNLPAGNYVVGAKMWDMEEPGEVWPVVFNGNVGLESQAEVIELNAEEAVDVYLQFQQGGLLSIEVLNPDDLWYNPFTDNIGIVIFPITTEGEVLWDVETNGDDFFVFEPTTMTLPVGTWTLVAVPAYLSASDEPAPSVQRTFFGDVGTFAEAQTFEITAGGFAEAVIRMTESGHSVSGSLETVTGHNLSIYPTVVAVDGDGLIAGAFSSFFGFSSDDYSIKGLADGNYRLFAAQEFGGGRYVSTWYPEVGDPGRTIENSASWPVDAEVVTMNGSDIEGADIVMQVGSGTVGVDPRDNPGTPSGYALSAAYPNPFNAMTSVSFTIPSTSRVKLDLVNILGQRVLSIEDRAYSAGAHRVMIDANTLTSGLYFVRMEAASFQAVQKLTLIK